ncbi:DUF2804 domain-containing protein [Isoptericola jiangsuensis]|uniref:DUF2804 domain-containing protein n=1 Tax=Isoptericola jiangsuensis TaxID=548579 RepID=UPI003AAB11BF
MTEREIVEAVVLCRPDGTLNPDAVGWSRTPQHDTSGLGRGMRGRGRTKRWEYWAVVTPTHVVGITTSALDYAALHQVYVLEKSTGVERGALVVAPLSGSVELPASLGAGPVRASTRRVAIEVDELVARGDAPAATRLRARTEHVELDVLVARPEGHEVLGVVVPWSDRQFQYTVKDVGRPVTGTLRVDGTTHEVRDPAWAVLDHGRGRWPYSATWQWGVGFGRVPAGGRSGHGGRAGRGSRSLGVQLGGTWTAAGPTTENALVVDGRLHKIHDELEWEVDRRDYLAPWRVRGARVDLTFRPFFNRVARTNLGVVASATDQCFGTWSGSVETDDGERLVVERLEGWAEDVRQRW